MTDDRSAFPLVALGGGAALAAVWLARSRAAHTAVVAPAVDLPPIGTPPAGAWVFPVPSLGDRLAEVSDGFNSPRTFPDGTKGKHLGVDVMFRRRGARDLIAVYIPGTPNGTKGYFMPDNTPALAASAGVVRFAQWTPQGFSVIVRHPSGWATYYTHLASLAVAKGDTVAGGQPLGTIGASPTDGERIKHLHFELWKDGTRGGAVDPQPYVEAWPRVTIADWVPSASIAVAQRGDVARPLRGAVGDGPFKHFDNVKTFDDLYNEQFKYLAQLRGFDELDPVPFDENSYGTGGPKKKIPRTTNLDVLALAGYWGKQLEDIKEVFGHAGIEKRWSALMTDVGKLAMYGNPTAVYPQNNKFWRALFQTAVHVAVADEAPSKWDMAKDSLKYSVTHLPDTLSHAASKTVDFVGSAAHAAGHIVSEAGKGLLGGLGTPLMIGGGLLGVYLLTRSRDRRGDEP